MNKFFLRKISGRIHAFSASGWRRPWLLWLHLGESAAVTSWNKIQRCCVVQVIIVAHHPVGSGSDILSESKWYEQLMTEFRDVIVLQVAGHNHADEFRLVKPKFHYADFP